MRLLIIRNAALVVLILLGFLISFAPSTDADTCSWSSAVGGDWSDISKWDCGHAPTSTDDASVTVDGTYTVTLNEDATVNSLTMGGTTGTQTFSQSSNTLTINNAGAFGANAVYDFSGGTITGAGTLSINGAFLWSDGTMSGTGVTNIPSGGMLNINGGTLVYLDTRTLNNSGTVTWTNSNSFCFQNNSVFNNLSGGLFDARNNFQLYNISGGTFNNSGTFRKSAGTGATSVGIIFNNDGTVDAQTGTVSFASTGTQTHTGSFNAASGATIKFGGGTHNLDAGSSVTGAGTIDFNQGTENMNGTFNVTGATSVTGGAANFNAASTVTSLGNTLTITGGAADFSSGEAINITTLNLSGGYLSGGDTVTVSGTTTWKGGYMSGTGVTNIPSGGTLNISGGTLVYLDTRTLNNSGTATWTNSNSFCFRNNAIFNNLSDGLFDARNNVQLYNISGGTFNNSGAFRKSAGTGTTTVGIIFNNTGGTVDAQTGAVSFTNTGTQTHTGSFNAVSGAALKFAGGTHNLDAGSSVTGGGIVDFFGGTVNVTGSYNVTGTSSFPGATVTFNAAATLINLGGVLTITGGTVDFSSGEAISVTAFTQSGGTLKGSDAVTVTGTGTWAGGTMTGAGPTNIVSGAIFGISANPTLDARTLNNSGTITYTGAGGYLTFQNAAVINNLSGAVFDIQNDHQLYNWTGTNTFNNYGTFRKSGGTGTTTVGIIFNNTGGTVDAQTGAVSFTSIGTQTHTGSFNAASGAAIKFAGGTHNLNAGSSVTGAGIVDFYGATVNLNGSYNVIGTTSVASGTANFTASSTITGIGNILSITGGTVDFSSGEAISVTTFTQSGGTLKGSDAVTVTGAGTWAGGTMTGAGPTNIVSGAIFGISANPTLDARTLNNSGTITYTGAGGYLTFQNAAVINNLSGAVFDIQSDHQLSNSSGTNTFNNSGTFRKSGGTGTTTVNTAFNTSGGTVDVQSGTIAFSGSGTHTGLFIAESGAKLQFSGGTNNLNSGSSVTGAGTVDFFGGTVNLNGSYNVIGTTSVASGTANFTASSTITGIGNILSITGGTVDFSSGEAISVATFTQSGGTLKGSDAVTVTGTGTWAGGTMTGAGPTNIVSGGTLNMSVASAYPTLDARTLNNSGTITYTGAIGYLTFQNAAVINNLSGAIFDVRNNQRLSNSSGTNTFNNSGTFRKSAGTGTTTVGIVFNNNGGTIDSQRGTLSFSSGISNSATGVLGGPSAGNTGIISITGGLTLTGTNSANIDIGGTTAGTQHDQLAVSGTATLAGGFNVSLVNGFIPAVGSSFQIVKYGSRSGAFATANLPTLPAGRKWDAVSYGASSVTLSVVGAPIIGLSPASYDFGNVAVGTTSAARTFTVSNTGNADLSVSAVSFTGASEFFRSGGTCPGSPPFTLTPGNSCSIDVRFAPTELAARSASLDISSDDIMNPAISATLSGAGVTTYTITASVSGGNGAISCNPASVTHGASFTCSLFPGAGYFLQILTDNGADVTSLVSADSYSVANVTADHNINGTFQSCDVKVIAGPVYYCYTDLQTAYNEAETGDVFEIKELSFYGNLNFNRSITVTLECGYDSAFISQPGYTTVNGTVTIDAGSVIVDRLIVQ